MLRRKKNGIFFLTLFAVISLGSTFLYSTGALAASPSSKMQRMTTFVGGDIHTLTFTKSSIFITGHEAGSYTTNEGLKWRAISSLDNADIMGWATTEFGYLAGGHNGLYTSTDNGKRFTRFKFYGNVSDVHSLGAAKKNVYLGSPQVGFLRSVDAGRTWKLVNKKIGQGFMGSMLVNPLNPLTVIAADMSNGLVLTTDGGKTWTRFGGPDGAMSVAWNSQNTKEILALGMGVGGRTTDGGKTWSAFSVPMGSSAIAISPKTKRIYVAILVGDRAKVLSSDNFGKSWG